MTNYEKIKAIIESWHIAQVEHDSWMFRLIFRMKPNWSLIGSRMWSSIDACYRKEDCVIYEEECVCWRAIKSITVYQKPVRYPKPWDKVQILESVKELPQRYTRNDSAKSMVWWPFVVKDCGDCCCEIYSNDGYSFSFDYRHIAPRIEEDEPKEMTIEEIQKELWYKIKVVE